ncbi:MAG: sulfatase-like hydrolase/transferase, partial [Myxococcales bacterium]|nr:sulfatase-like hydrolase/transferase [Myxococcales bacterium]
VDEDCDGSDLRGAALAAAGRWDFPVPDAAPTRPDVILITVDALSARRMGVLGYPRKITEHLDDLARRSAFFEAYFTQGPSTRLSFPAMFTGRWDTVIEREPVFRHIPHPIATSERQVQDVFGDAGYDTVAIIPDAYFLPSFWPSLTRGFARVDTSALLRTKEEILRAGGHTADGVTRAALRVLDSKRKKPLFLWAHYYDAHSPYNQPPNAPIFGTTPNDVHDAEVWSVDRAMAPLLERLVDRPNTLLVVTADHATVFHPNPKTRKGHYGYDVYTATLHAPLIVHAPWIRPRRWPKPTSSLDVLPTLANMLRTNPKATLFGTSLVPEIFDASDAHPQYVFSEFFLEERAIRDGKDGLLAVGVRDDRYNLILDRGTGAYELYDWRKDYFETDNLATDPGHRADFDRLKALVGAFVFEMSEKPRQRRAEAARSAPMPTPVPGVLPPSDPR